MIDVKLDLNLLKILTNRDAYLTYRGQFRLNTLSKEAKEIVKGYKEYYSCFPDKEECDLKEFSGWFFDYLHSDWDEETQEFYKHVLSTVFSLEETDIRETLLGLKRKALWKELEEIKNKSFDTIKMGNIIEKFNTNLSIDDEDFFTTDLSEATQLLKQTGQLYWRLDHLNEIVGPIGIGTFVLLGAYQNQGKSSFCVSEATFMMSQLPDSKRVLYFNNEEHNSRVLYRIYAAALGVPIQKLWEDPEAYKAAYEKVTGGRSDRVLIFDIEGKHLSFLEEKCKKYNPGLVIIDQIDKLMSSKKQDNARPYEDLYSQIRRIGKQYAPVIGVTQASGNAMYFSNNGEMRYREWLSQKDLHWSTVDKQANNEVLLMMGTSNDFSYQRNFSVERNKLNGKTGRFSAILNSDIMQFEDV